MKLVYFFYLVMGGSGLGPPYKYFEIFGTFLSWFNRLYVSSAVSLLPLSEPPRFLLSPLSEPPRFLLTTLSEPPRFLLTTLNLTPLCHKFCWVFHNILPSQTSFYVMHLNTVDNQIKKCVGNIILFFYLILTFKFYIGRYLRFHFLFLGVNDITESKFQA